MSKAEKPETKLCPLKPWVTASGAMLSEIFCKCLEEQCAWWVNGKCTEVIKAESLESIAKSLEEIIKLIKTRT